MARFKDWDWDFGDKVETWEEAQAAILMDIRDELKAMNRVLNCPNFIGLPNEIRRIRQAAEKKSRRRKAVRR